MFHLSRRIHSTDYEFHTFVSFKIYLFDSHNQEVLKSVDHAPDALVLDKCGISFVPENDRIFPLLVLRINLLLCNRRR